MGRILRLFKMFRGDLATLLFAIFNRRTPGKVRIGMIAAILYLISPIDLVPDTLPVVGMLDDAVLVPMAMMVLTNMLPESVKRDSEVRAWKYSKYMPLIMGAIGVMVLFWVFMVIYGLYALIFK